MEDRTRRDDWRHARFLRLLPDRIRAGIYCRRLAADIRAVGDDPPRLRHQRTLRVTVLRLAGGQDRPPEGHDRHRAQLFARHRRDGADAARGMDLSRHLPPARRPRGYRALLGRYHGGAGICAGLQARLDYRTDHDDVAGGRAARRVFGGLCNALYRLARDVRGRTAARGADALHSRLGSGIAALADAHGTGRGGASLARLGIAGRSRIDTAPGSTACDRPHPLARTVQISAQSCRRMPHRPDPDRWGRTRRCGW